MAAEKLKIKIVNMDEDARTRVMYQQITAFEDKINLCSQTFSVDTLCKMLREANKLPKAKKMGGVYSVAKVKQLLQEEGTLSGSVTSSPDIKSARKSKDTLEVNGSKNEKHLKPPEGFKSGVSTPVNPDPKTNRILMYFKWFLEYLRYLRELKINFVDRVFNPLHEFFNDDLRKELSSPNIEYLLSTPTVTPSSAMLRSQSTPEEAENGQSESETVEGGSESSGSDGFATPDIPDRKTIAYNVLLELGKEFSDISQLYDNTEQENVAERLGYLKERWEVLLEDECEVNPDLFSLESFGSTEKYADEKENMVNFLRLVPDILKKCQKAAILSRRWLDIDRGKTKDLHEKLNKIKTIQKSVSEKLAQVEKYIESKEKVLINQIDELQNLLLREERCHEIGIQVFETDQNITNLESSLQNAEKERGKLIEELTEAKEKKSKDYKTIRLKYEQNRLQRYLLVRTLSVEKFRKLVLEGDMNVELEVRPSMIRFTDHVQDVCEELEQQLEKQNAEKRKLEKALIPLQEDHHKVQEKLWQEEGSRRNSIADFRRTPNNQSKLQVATPMSVRSNHLQVATPMSNKSNNLQVASPTSDISIRVPTSLSNRSDRRTIGIQATPSVLSRQGRITSTPESLDNDNDEEM